MWLGVCLWIWHHSLLSSSLAAVCEPPGLPQQVVLFALLHRTAPAGVHKEHQAMNPFFITALLRAAHKSRLIRVAETFFSNCRGRSGCGTLLSMRCSISLPHPVWFEWWHKIEYIFINTVQATGVDNCSKLNSSYLEQWAWLPFQAFVHRTNHGPLPSPPTILGERRPTRAGSPASGLCGDNAFCLSKGPPGTIPGYLRLTFIWKRMCWGSGVAIVAFLINCAH